MTKPQPLSEEGRRLAAAIARDLERVLNRVERHGGPRQPTKEQQLYGIVRNLRAIADGTPVEIHDEGS